MQGKHRVFLPLLQTDMHLRVPQAPSGLLSRPFKALSSGGASGTERRLVRLDRPGSFKGESKASLSCGFHFYVILVRRSSPEVRAGCAADLVAQQCS